MDEAQYRRFMKELEKWNQMYDPNLKMIRKPFHSPGYHTTLKGGFVHPTRDTFTYAVALLDSGIEEYRQRAEEVLEKVLSLQDTDPSSKTYGIWSWFYEEPLEQMSPPDWNWADFCGKELLQVALDHSDRISPDLLRKVKKSIYHAAQSIIRRNMGPHYTNIAIMGTYVTLVAGQILKDDKIWEYGKNRLRRIHEYTMYHGAFTEYNSPTYTIVALEDISRMLLHVKDKECLEMIEDLNLIGWKCLAEHFHPATWQWAGPHSRCYKSIQDKLFWSRIQIATDGKVRFLPDDELESQITWHRIKLKCPEEFLPYFTDIDGERYIRETFYKGSRGERSQTAVTFMTPQYTIGSFCQSEMWNQRRALIGYFGNHKQPVCMHMRFLHDGYDYSSATFHCVQSKNKLLAILNFATDGGDTHISLDKIINATIQASDLRLRLEFTGAIDQLECPKEWEPNQSIICRVNETFIHFLIPKCSFGDFPISYEIIREDDKIGIDVVFYQGENRTICFNELSEAICVMAMQIHDGDLESAAPMNIALTLSNDKLRASWIVDDETLSIEAHRQPQPFQILVGS